MNYSSPLRDEQARVTQRRILEAAHGLFLQHGYPATTMAGIARAAGVSPQTVYNAFGTKPALLKRVYDVQLAGDDEPVPLAQRPELRRLYATSDPREFLAGYVHLGRLLLERLAPLVRVVLAGAATGDPDLRALVDTLNAERLVGTGQVATRLAELGALRVGLSVEGARDTIWTLNSVEVWHLLVELRGWSPDAYEEWTARAMAAAVLPR